MLLLHFIIKLLSVQNIVSLLVSLNGIFYSHSVHLSMFGMMQLFCIFIPVLCKCSTGKGDVVDNSS